MRPQVSILCLLDVGKEISVFFHLNLNIHWPCYGLRTWEGFFCIHLADLHKQPCPTPYVKPLETQFRSTDDKPSVKLQEGHGSIKHIRLIDERPRFLWQLIFLGISVTHVDSISCCWQRAWAAGNISVWCQAMQSDWTFKALLSSLRGPGGLLHSEKYTSEWWWFQCQCEREDYTLPLICPWKGGVKVTIIRKWLCCDTKHELHPNRCDFYSVALFTRGLGSKVQSSIHVFIYFQIN